MNLTFFRDSNYYLQSLYVSQAFACITFSILAISVLIYFIKRIFNLYKEMKSISPDQLYNHNKFNFRNHLKNLKIKALITNFIIAILLIEIVNNIVSSLIFVNICFRYLNAFESIIWYLHQIGFITYFCYIPILCTLMNLLWLVYLHSEWKNSVKRWAAYIIIRLIAIYIVFSWQNLEYATNDKHLYKHIYIIVNWLTRITFEIIDLVTYVKYSRRFYFHLKSRVLEAKLFCNKREYLQNNNLCCHFKIATAIVFVAFLLHTIGDVNFIIRKLTSFTSIDTHHQIFTETEWNYAIQIQELPLTTFHLLYRILLNLNYFYLFSIFILMRWKQRLDFNKVNDRIRPLVKRYQETVRK